MRKLFTSLLVMMLMISTLVFPTEASEVSYLALGDSVSTGFGLYETDPSFTEIVAQKNQYALNNQAMDGQTMKDVANVLKSGALDEAVVNAEFITLTCGGNDMMDLLYLQIATTYNQTYEASISADDVPLILLDKEDVRYNDLLMLAYDVLTTFASTEAYTQGLQAFKVSLNEAMTYIRSKNGDAVVMMLTQYNPYKVFSTHGLYQGIYNTMKIGASDLNAIILELSEPLNYVVADVYAVFEASTENLCNATYTPNLNLDFHPNYRGHEVIADVVMEAIPVKEEVTLPPTVDQLQALMSVVIESETNHVFELMENTYTVSEVVDHTCEVTIHVEAYLEVLNENDEGTFTLLEGEATTKTITFTYQEGQWKVDEEVTFKASYEEKVIPENPVIPEGPENPETPEEPENPLVPEQPENPETPEIPEQPKDEWQTETGDTAVVGLYVGFMMISMFGLVSRKRWMNSQY